MAAPEEDIDVEYVEDRDSASSLSMLSDEMNDEPPDFPEYPWFFNVEKMNSNMPQWVLHDDIDQKSRSTIEKMLLEEHLYSGKRVHTRSGCSKRGKRRRPLFYKSKRSIEPSGTHRMPWSEEEQQVFNHGREIHGNQWTKIADLIPTRTILQVKNHAAMLQKKAETIAEPKANVKKQTKLISSTQVKNDQSSVTASPTQVKNDQSSVVVSPTQVKNDQSLVTVSPKQKASQTCNKEKSPPKRIKIASTASNSLGKQTPRKVTPGKETPATENVVLKEQFYKRKSPSKMTPVVMLGEAIKLQNVESDEDFDIDVEVDSDADPTIYFPDLSEQKISSQAENHAQEEYSTSDASIKTIDNADIERFSNPGKTSPDILRVPQPDMETVYVDQYNTLKNSVGEITKSIFKNVLVKVVKANVDGVATVTDAIKHECYTNDVQKLKKACFQGQESQYKHLRVCLEKLPPHLSKSEGSMESESKGHKSENLDNTSSNQVEQTPVINNCISKMPDNEEKESPAKNETFTDPIVKDLFTAFGPEMSQSLEETDHWKDEKSAMESQMLVKEFETSQSDLSAMTIPTSNTPVDPTDVSSINKHSNSKINEMRSLLCMKELEDDQNKQENVDNTDNSKRTETPDGNIILDNNASHSKDDESQTQENLDSNASVSSNKTAFVLPAVDQQSFGRDEMTINEKLNFQDYVSQFGICKSPVRFLLIRNIILDAWKSHKPNYVNKSLIRQELEKRRKLGNVNHIGCIHHYLEDAGAINVGLENPHANWRLRMCNENKIVNEEKKVIMMENRRISMRPKRKKEVDNEVEEKSPVVRISRSQPKQKPKPYDPFKLIACSNFSSSTPAPLNLKVSSKSLVVMDLHAHFSGTEVIGLLGGSYEQPLSQLTIQTAVPCNSLSTGMQCEMDPVSQTEACEAIIDSGLQVVGWYHSHPTFPPNPSVRDIETQSQFQSWFVQGGAPFIGVIVNPYGRNFQNESEFRFMTICEQWLDGEMCKQPFQFVIDVVHPTIDSNELITTTISLLHKFKTYNYRIEMMEKYRNKGELTYLEKMLLSVKKCLMLDGGSLQAGLIEKIRDVVVGEFEK